MGCRFFFEQVRAEIDDKFPNLSGEGGNAKAKIATKGTIDGYGWLNSLYDIAKDGIFTKDNQSAVESVLVTNLYEILTYLSWKSACNSYEEKLNDINKKTS
tara:strand:+ start:103 stop:405 length:303 start_codon:yes stop_codon:yes gene_type:complete